MLILRIKFFSAFVLVPLLTSVVLAQPGTNKTLIEFENELRSLVNVSTQFVVTVTSTFSQDISSEQESGILSIFRNESRKQSLLYTKVGSGIIWDAQGHILTRSSVVIGSQTNEVLLPNGDVILGKFIGHDPESGFAIIQVENLGLQPALFGDSNVITPGSLNFVIGNSLGVYPSVVLGHVNGLRSDGMIQLSANLNPGNNGSAIINTRGEVVGVIAGHIGTATTGFSQPFGGWQMSATTLVYPINWVKKIASDLIENGFVEKGWLGVVGYYSGQKPIISEIRPGSPAQEAGLIEGDIITKYASADIQSIAQLAKLVEYTKPGASIPVEFIRDNEIFSSEVIIKAKMDSTGSKTRNTLEVTVAEKEQSAFFTPQPKSYNEDREHLIEKRIDYLEKEVAQLKRLLENR